MLPMHLHHQIQEQMVILVLDVPTAHNLDPHNLLATQPLPHLVLLVLVVGNCLLGHNKSSLHLDAPWLY